MHIATGRIQFDGVIDLRQRHIEPLIQHRHQRARQCALGALRRKLLHLRACLPRRREVAQGETGLGQPKMASGSPGSARTTLANSSAASRTLPRFSSVSPRAICAWTPVCWSITNSVSLRHRYHTDADIVAP